jgi:hypothetical protein
MDEHYIMNVLKALGQKIDTLEFMSEEYKRNAIALEEENAHLRKRIAELEAQHGR